MNLIESARAADPMLALATVRAAAAIANTETRWALGQCTELPEKVEQAIALLAEREVIRREVGDILGQHRAKCAAFVAALPTASHHFYEQKAAIAACQELFLAVLFPSGEKRHVAAAIRLAAAAEKGRADQIRRIASRSAHSGLRVARIDPIMGTVYVRDQD